MVRKHRTHSPHFHSRTTRKIRTASQHLSLSSSPSLLLAVSPFRKCHQVSLNPTRKGAHGYSRHYVYIQKKVRKLRRRGWIRCVEGSVTYNLCHFMPSSFLYICRTHSFFLIMQSSSLRNVFTLFVAHFGTCDDVQPSFHHNCRLSSSLHLNKLLDMILLIILLDTLPLRNWMARVNPCILSIPLFICCSAPEQ